MTIYSRDYKGKKQYRFRVGYKDVFGKSKRKQSKWFDKRGDCVEAEKMFVAHVTLIPDIIIDWWDLL